MECTVCIDVATRRAQMYSRSGASVSDIRAAIEQECPALSDAARRRELTDALTPHRGPA